MVAQTYSSSPFSAAGTALNRATVLGALTFEEDFTAPLNAKAAVWTSEFWYGEPNAPSSREYGNGDLQIFSGPGYNGVTPWIVTDDQLLIQARPCAKPSLPVNGGKAWTSGALTTYWSFSQTYGYFEAKLRAEVAPGMWPAFFLLGRNTPLDANMEIDILEALGSTPGSAFQSWHLATPPANQWAENTVTSSNANECKGVDGSADHIYGVLWTPTVLTFFIDDVATYSIPNPGFHTHMYILLALAVGPGSWNNNLPAAGWQGGDMTVDYVRAWALAAGVK